MPTLIASHVVLDVPTLFAVTLFVTVIGGLLLLFAFLQNREHAGAGAVGHRLSRRRDRRRLALRAGDGRHQRLGGWRRQCIAVHRLWLHVVRRAQLRRPARQPHRSRGRSGAVDRRVSIRWLRAIAAARISVVAAITASYALLAARELWYARDRDLLSRWPTLVLVIGHAGFLLARIPYAQDLASSVSSGHAHGAVGDRDGVRSAVRRFLPAVPARRHVEGARRTRAAVGGGDRPADRRAQSARVFRSRQSVARALHGRTQAGGAVAVRSRPLQGRQRHGRPSGGRSGAAGLLRSRRHVRSAPAICSAGSAARNSPT